MNWVVGNFLASKKYKLLGVILRVKKCSENIVYDRHFEKITRLEKNVDSLFRNVSRYYKALSKIFICFTVLEIKLFVRKAKWGKPNFSGHISIQFFLVMMC